jgi:hypothetical protein
VSREERQLLSKLVAALNQLGNNVNQLASAKNLARITNADEPEDFVIEQAALSVLSLVAEIKERIKL